ncbi:MAG: hypothetical protein U9N11_04990, partial [Campylobacterota bacterium]|nr:hypothetical protein [Campylobacterota bacterium]
MKKSLILLTIMLLSLTSVYAADLDNDGVNNSTTNTGSIVFNDYDSDNDGVTDSIEMGAGSCTSSAGSDILTADGTFDGFSGYFDNQNIFDSSSSITNNYNGQLGWTAYSTVDLHTSIAAAGITSDPPLPYSFGNGASASPQGSVFAALYMGEPRADQVGLTYIYERLSTSVNNLTVGQTYKVSFYETNLGVFFGSTCASSSYSTRFKVTFGDTTQYSSGVSCGGLTGGNQQWVRRELEFTATSTFMELEFEVRPGVANESMSNPFSNSAYPVAYAGLDDVQVQAINTTCTTTDTDQDNTPDYLDYDSDNDGCLDAIEAYGDLDAAGSDGTEYG